MKSTISKGVGVAVVCFTGCLAAASASSTHACPTVRSPSNFDYLVLASIADSPRLPAMAGYRTHDLNGAVQ
jgi:hypothetical protein